MPNERLFEMLRRELNSAALGDILDKRGQLHRFLPPGPSPLDGARVVAGRAMPVLQADVSGPQETPFGLMTRALDDLAPNEVYVATGGRPRSASWGEIMTATAKARGAAGAVIHGF